MLGFGGGRRGGRLPSVAAAALLALALLASLHCWDVRGQRGRLLEELAEARAQAKRTDAARSRLEKRSSELMAQAEAQRQEAERREGERGSLRDSLRGLEARLRGCSDDKAKMQRESLSQVSEIQRLKEQLKELKDEYLKQEGLLQELKNNRTSMEKKLEFESLQCKQKINQLNEEHLVKQRVLEEEAFRLRKQNLSQIRAVATINKAEADFPKLTVDHPDMKELRKLAVDGGGAGMEDSNTGNVNDAPFALRKPTITRKQGQRADPPLAQRPAAGDGPAKEQDQAGTLGSKVLPLKLETKMERPAAGAGIGANDVSQEQGPVEGRRADILPGQQGQLPAPDRVVVVAADDRREGLQGAPKPDQVLLKPMENEPARKPHPVQNPLVEGQRGAEGGRHQAVDML